MRQHTIARSPTGTRVSIASGRRIASSLHHDFPCRFFLTNRHWAQGYLLAAGSADGFLRSGIVLIRSARGATARAAMSRRARRPSALVIPGSVAVCAHHQCRRAVAKRGAKRRLVLLRCVPNNNARESFPSPSSIHSCLPYAQRTTLRARRTETISAPHQPNRH